MRLSIGLWILFAAIVVITRLHLQPTSGNVFVPFAALLRCTNRSSRFALNANRKPVVFADLGDVPQELQSQVTESSHMSLKKVREFVSKDKRLVKHGASVDQESVGTTTLHWCVRREDVDLAKYLIEQGADIEAQGYKFDRHGRARFDPVSK